MKIQLVVLAAVVCIVLGYGSPVESFKKKFIGKSISKETVHTPVVANKQWSVEVSKTNTVRVHKVASVSAVKRVPTKGKWFRPAQSPVQEWHGQPQVPLASGTKGLSKVHWVTKRAPIAKRVPCRTTERPTLRPNLAASQAKPATTSNAFKSTQKPLPVQEELPAKQPWAPAPVASALPTASTLQPAKQVAPAPVVSQSQQVEALAKEPVAAPAGAAKMSFAAEPERFNYDEVMEPEQ